MGDSFISLPADTGFGLNNLPFGVFSTRDDPTHRIGVAIGDHVLDLKAISNAGLFSGPVLSSCNSSLQQSTLNDFMSLGRPAWQEARSTMQRLLSSQEGVLRDNPSLLKTSLLPCNTVTMHLPAQIGDYTDFYCSKEHATHCGVIFRGTSAPPLQPNWLHLPVGYHGRSSSIVVSGTDVRRPWGQMLGSDGKTVFRPCQVLDFELEMGCFIGTGNELGSPIPITTAESHMFGFVLLNDWSARDVQRWEYVPLGPFTSKNWATSISPWVVTLDALEPYKTPAPVQDPPVLPYLEYSLEDSQDSSNYSTKQVSERCNYDVNLEVSLIPSEEYSSASTTHNNSSTTSLHIVDTNSTSTVIARSNLRSLYWTVPQMIAHHTAGGCNLRPGDVLATGTLSLEGPNAQGCLLELSSNGAHEIDIVHGGKRKFLEDGDQVVLRGWCEREGCEKVDFGECRGKVLPAS